MGEMAERTNAPVLKTGGQRPRGFESLSHREGTSVVSAKRPIGDLNRFLPGTNSARSGKASLTAPGISFFGGRSP